MVGMLAKFYGSKSLLSNFFGPILIIASDKERDQAKGVNVDQTVIRELE